MKRIAHRAALGTEIALAYVKAKRLMRAHDLPTTLRGLRSRSENGEVSEGDATRGAMLGNAVVQTLDTLPTDSRCLIRSLVLTRLLDRRGIPGTLVIGVQPGDDFGAHAWVEVAGQPVLDPGDDRFGRLVEL